MEKKNINFIDFPATGFLRQSQLIPALLPFSAATLWRMVRAGTFPSPVKLSQKITAWKTCDVVEWANSK